MVNVDDRFLSEATIDQFWFMCHVATFMNEHSTCFPSNQRLCECTGWKISKLNAVKKSCIDAGFLKVETRYANNRQSSNEYTVLTDRLSIMVSLKGKKAKQIPATDAAGCHTRGTPPATLTAPPPATDAAPEVLNSKEVLTSERDARAKNSPTLKTETPLSENKAGGGAAQNPPSPESVAYTTDPAELEMLLRTYYMARPDDWKVIKERLDRAAAQAGKKYDKEKIADVVSRYCDWTITKGHTGWTFSQHHSRLRMWMADQPGKELQTNQSATTDAKTGVYTPPKRLITA